MSGFYFTKHALERCRERGIDPEEVITALTSCRTRVQATDDRSVTFAFRRLRIVCNARDGSIVTVYRFNPVKRQLKKRRQDFQKYRQEDLQRQHDREAEHRRFDHGHDGAESEYRQLHDFRQHAGRAHAGTAEDSPT